MTKKHRKKTSQKAYRDKTKNNTVAKTMEISMQYQKAIRKAKERDTVHVGTVVYGDILAVNVQSQSGNQRAL